MNLPSVQIFGLAESRCDTMKKALIWLRENNISYELHDYKKEGIDELTLREWVKNVGWEILLNRRGMMWRKVPDEVKTSINESSALQLMLETPSIIKRPVLIFGDKFEVGFKPDKYESLLK